MKMFDHPEILALLPLDKASWAALACTSRAMHDAVAAARCIRGVRVGEANVSILAHPRYESLTTLRIRTRRHTPSPIPVPRPMPHLRFLELDGCQPLNFWDVVADRAPRLRHLVVRPAFTVETYASSLLSLAHLAECLPRMRLDALEVKGTGSVVWGNLSYAIRHGPGIRAAQTCQACPIPMPSLTRLCVTGQQVALHVRAPLDNVDIEELNDDDVSGPRMLDGLGSVVRVLCWSAPASRFPSPHFPPHLSTLDLRVRAIQTPGLFDECVRTLASVPASLTSLRVDLDISHMEGSNPFLDYDRRPLAHLVILTKLEVWVSFPTRGCQALVHSLLGAPSRSLVDVQLAAYRSPTEAMRRDWSRFMIYEFLEDPESEIAQEFIRDIVDMDDQCCLSADDIERARSQFPSAHIRVHSNFQNQPPPYPPPPYP